MTAQIINFNQRKMEMKKELVEVSPGMQYTVYPPILLGDYDLTTPDLTFHFYEDKNNDR